MPTSPTLSLNFPSDDVPAPEAPAPESRVAEPPRLFGWEDTPGVVAVEVDGSEAILIRMALPGEELPPGAVTLGPCRDRFVERRPFKPWLLADGRLSEPINTGTLGNAKWKRLEGNGLTWLVEFPSWGAFLDGREELRADGHPHHAYGHPVKQFLVRSGVTQFKGLEFSSIRRMQFDLETTTLRPADPGSRILLIVAGDNHGGEWVFYNDDERRLIRDFLAVVKEADPDVLEGHNLFGFDLPYLAERAQALGIPLEFGRNGATLSFGRERNLPIGGITRPFRPANAWGRHFTDTLFAVQRFDIARGELTSHALKEVAVYFGLASPDRVYVDRAQIGELWQTEPERVRRYALQDVEETRALADLTLPTEFYQSQMVPESYQTVATGGTGEKINSLIIREYLRQGCGIPQPQPAVACPGGFTEIRETGVLRGVVKADVESLYPSIMLRYGIKPEGDVLGVFLPMLSELRTRRLDAKARARAGGPEREYWDGLQNSFKILINSFYGYLGAVFNFNDYAAATRVTTTGQELVKKVAEEFERTGSRIIEIDTDGVYFVPPSDVTNETEEEAYIERVGAVLPPGIRLAHDGRYAAMVSLKIKNYVLVGYDGKKVVKGASLRSRADEPYAREFLAYALDALIAGEPQRAADEYQKLSEQLRAGDVKVERLARRERVTEKTFRSDAKRKSREVARNAGVGESIVVYQRADGTLGLAEEYAHDEDRWHYLEKLYRFAERLAPVVGNDFPRLFPAPSKKELVAEQVGQLALF